MANFWNFGGWMYSSIPSQKATFHRWGIFFRLNLLKAPCGGWVMNIFVLILCHTGVPWAILSIVGAWTTSTSTTATTTYYYYYYCYCCCCSCYCWSTGGEDSSNCGFSLNALGISSLSHNAMQHHYIRSDSLNLLAHFSSKYFESSNKKIYAKKHQGDASIEDIAWDWLLLGNCHQNL